MIDVAKTMTRLTVSGHSNTSEEDKTEETIQACASVTALVQTLLFGILSTEENAPDYEISRGWFWLDTEFLSGSSLFLIDVFMMGIQSLSEAYPDCVSVKTYEHF